MGKQLTESDKARIEKILYMNELKYESVELEDNSIVITIKHGDWKNSHLFLEFIMGDEGYYSNERVIIEDEDYATDGDSFSARYIFRRK